MSILSVLSDLSVLSVPSVLVVLSYLSVLMTMTPILCILPVLRDQPVVFPSRGICQMGPKRPAWKVWISIYVIYDIKTWLPIWIWSPASLLMLCDALAWWDEMHSWVGELSEVVFKTFTLIDLINLVLSSQRHFRRTVGICIQNLCLDWCFQFCISITSSFHHNN